MLTGILVILLLLILLLAIPVRLRFRVNWREAFDNDFRFEWAFGLVQAQIPGGKDGKTPGRIGAGDKPSPEPSSRKRRGNVVAAVRHRPFRRRVLRFLGDLWRAAHKEDVRLHVRLGLGDPADTGQLWAILGPASGMLANVRFASISIEPEFVEPALELDGSGSIRVIPLQVVLLAAAFMLSPSVWAGVRRIRAAG